MKKLLVSLILVTLLFTLHSYPAEPLYFNHISKTDGLSDDLIFAIFQDSIGYIWIGTSNGLNRYDGTGFKTFLHDPVRPGSISHNVITGICEDSSSNLWLATYGGGISRFDRRTGTFRNYRTLAHQKGNENPLTVNQIFCDTKNRLWVATKGNGLFRMDPKTGKSKRYGSRPGDPSSPGTDYIMSTFEDSSGNIWVATWGSGLYRYIEPDGDIQKELPVSGDDNGVRSLYIHSILEDPEKNLWLGTGENGLVKYTKSTGTIKSYGVESGRNVNLRGKKISSIYRDPENGNLIWVGTGNGLYIYNIAEDRFTRYASGTGESNLSGNYIWVIRRDRSGMLWIGTIGSGLNLEKRGSECFRFSCDPDDEKNILVLSDVSAIHPVTGDDNMLWVGTLGKGLNKVDLKAGKAIPIHPSGDQRNPMAGMRITSIATHPANPEILYLGTDSGLKKYNSVTNTYSRLESPLESQKKFNTAIISSLLASGSSQQVLWAGTLGKGLYKLDLGKYRLSNYLFQEELKNTRDRNRVHTIFRSPSADNILWLGTNRGLAAFDIRSGSFTLYNPEKEGKKSETPTVLSIHESAQLPGILWCGTREKGLYRFNISSRSFEHPAIREGLPDLTVVSITEEPRGNLWLGTLKGLSRFIVATGNFRNFDQCEGLINPGYHLNTSRIGKNRKIFIGGPRGIDCFAPARLNTNITIPPVVLTDLKIFGSSELPGMDEILKYDISTIRELTLPRNYHTLTFYFAALDYTSPGKNQFACRMEGLDEGWIYLGTKNSVEYRDLKPGKYTFVVKGSNSHSVWNQVGKKLQITIQGSVTGSFWFWLLVVFLSGGSVFLLRFLFHRLKKSRVPPGATIEQLLEDEIITEREKEIIGLIMQGKSNKEIEDELFISLGTVKNHLYNIYKKLNIKSRTQLVSIVRSEEKE